MTSNIAELVEQVRKLEDQISAALAATRESIDYELHERKVVFEKEVLERHHQLKTGLFRFLRTAPFLTVLTAPVIYSLIVPVALLDLSVSIYQWICFSAWGIPRVRRSEYIVIDRQYLAYLNGIEKLNCVYCGYANGVIAFAREIAGITEQYWCPIKHAHQSAGRHERALEFLEYGDAENWRKSLGELRKKLKELEQPR